MTSPSDFPTAYRRFLAPVRAKCRRLLGRTAAADDVAQEAFVRLWQSGPRLDGQTGTRTIMAWLYLTSTRLAMDVLRQRKRDAHDIAEGDAELGSCASAPDEVMAARSMIVALCNRIPADEVEAAILTRVDGLPQTQVALILGVSERTVRRLLERFDERSAEVRKELMS